MNTVHVPVASSTLGPRVRVLPQVAALDSTVPPGRTNETTMPGVGQPPPKVEPVIVTVRESPTVPENLNRAFTPRSIVVNDLIGPPGLIEGETSTTSSVVRFASPVPVPWGSMRIVQVPVASRVVASIHTLSVQLLTGPTSAVPLGRTSETANAGQPVIVDWLT